MYSPLPFKKNHHGSPNPPPPPKKKITIPLAPSKNNLNYLKNQQLSPQQNK